jgi:hypothetical protein
VRNRAQILIALALLVAASGCGRKVTEAVTRQYAGSDTLRVVETVRVDTVTVPGETITVEVPVAEGCDSLMQLIGALQETQRARVSITTRPRTATAPATLVVRADCKEYEAQVQRLERETERLKSQTATSETVTTVREQYVAWYHKWAMYWAGISAAYAVVRIAWWAAKKYINPLA